MSRLPPNLVGYAIINGFTFGVDLVLLSIFHGALGWPLPLAITVAYVAAFGLSFVLNRAFNFRSHAPVGRQTVLYAAAIGVNYAAFLLGVSTALVALGVPYQVARVTAGVCEGVFMYCALRWVVFARRFEPRPDAGRSPGRSPGSASEGERGPGDGRQLHPDRPAVQDG